MHEPDNYKGIINCSGGGATVRDVKIEFHIHIDLGGSYEQSVAKMSELQGSNGRRQLLNDQEWRDSVLVSALRYLLKRATSSRALSSGDETIAVEKES